jgi:transposase InsO family protein
MKAHGQQNRRGRAKVTGRRAPTTHKATAPNQVWCWDITWLPSSVRGQFFYWYMVKDVFSRKIVASEVHIAESSSWAAELLKRGTLKENVRDELILHSDNGSAMKGSTLLATMQNSGVVPSFSRPRVSNDNAFAETVFRTAKYCPAWPSKPFESLEKAREWVDGFVAWYNGEHRHSGIRFVTPDERHGGKAEELLQRRHRLYLAARERHPQRWSGNTRNWTLENEVFLNPERSEKAA